MQYLDLSYSITHHVVDAGVPEARVGVEKRRGHYQGLLQEKSRRYL